MRLIDADAVRQKREDFAITSNPEMNRFNRMFVDLFNREIDNAPTIDAVPVVHGHWSKLANNNYGVVDAYQCSVCGEEYSFPSWAIDEVDDDYVISMMHYCCNCGAKMDEEVQE